MPPPPNSHVLLTSPAGVRRACSFLVATDQARTETLLLIGEQRPASPPGRYRFTDTADLESPLIAAVDVTATGALYLSYARDLPGVNATCYDYAAFLAALPKGPWSCIRASRHFSGSATAALLIPGRALLCLHLGQHYELPLLPPEPAPFHAVAYFPTTTALTRFIDIALVMLNVEDSWF